MISSDPALTSDELRHLTGWELKPEGLCKGEVCVPFRPEEGRAADDNRIDLKALADRLGAGLVHDPDHGLWAMGPAAPGQTRFLTDSQFPELTLPDLDGQPFSFSSLRGRKVVMVAWASW